MGYSRSAELGWLAAQPYAHRGLHGSGIPENSLAGFAAAAEHGYGIELDVRLSSDHEVMVFHDNRLDRLAGRPDHVCNLTGAELRRIPLAGGPETIPALADVLALVAGRAPILIELKNPFGPVGPLESAVARTLAHYQGPAAVMSFNPHAVDWFRRCAPAIPRGLVASTRLVLRDQPDGPLASFTWRQILSLQSLQADFLAYDIRRLPSAATNWAMLAGLPVLTWTVRTADQLARARRFADAPIFEHVRPD